MLLSEKNSKCFIRSESSEINLPTEVWTHIWSFLDFKKLQRVCTLVSKEWFFKIRNSVRLSGEMTLRIDYRNVEDINYALSLWPKLKVLHLSDCICFYRSCKCEGTQLSKLVSYWEKSKKCTLNTERLGVYLTDNVLLRKIILQKAMPFKKLGNWGQALKVCFDPKNWNPANLENVNCLKIFVDYVPKNVKMLHIGQVLINVEELFITGKKGMFDVEFDYVEFDSEFISRLQKFLLGFKKLTMVRIVVPVDITDFLDFLQVIANLKDVKFSLTISIVHDHLERKYVKGVFEEGFKIIKNTFPNESTSLLISDVQYEDIDIEKKYNKKPKLNALNLDDVRGRRMKNQPKIIPA